MSKIRLAPNALIFGTAFALLTVSGLSNISFLSTAAADNYVAPANSSTVQSLGTIQSQTTTTTTTTSPAPTMPAMQGNPNKALPQPMPQTTADTDSTLQPQQSGNITYITGGIGDEERNTLQSVKKDYNLHVMSATGNGAFAGDTKIAILDHNDGELVNTSSGPIFLAKLPAGRYTVQATHDGVVKKQTISVSGSKPATVHFSW